MSGKNGERFVRIHCHKCQEHLFFQNPELPNNIKSPEDISEQWQTEQINNLQIEWEEWFRWKKRHLDKSSTRKTPLSKYAQWFLALLLGGSTIFFVLDRWHLLDPLLENPAARQELITEYAESLLEVPCFPSIMKIKIRTVPIRYTRERPVHKNWIQYGEAGIYWGE